MQLYYIADLRKEFNQKYITFWRPTNNGYAWPLAWSGKYGVLDLTPGYHQIKEGRSFIRFAVPCEFVDTLTTMSDAGDIDNGPHWIVLNTKENRQKLRAKRFDIKKSVVDNEANVTMV